MRTDTERLDWLESHKGRWPGFAVRLHSEGEASLNHTSESRSIRDAIDAAMGTDLQKLREQQAEYLADQIKQLTHRRNKLITTGGEEQP